VVTAQSPVLTELGLQHHLNNAQMTGVVKEEDQD
jgi:hypothetical protein